MQQEYNQCLDCALYLLSLCAACLLFIYYCIYGMFVYNVEEKLVQGSEDNIFGGLGSQYLYSLRHLLGSSF